METKRLSRVREACGVLMSAVQRSHAPIMTYFYVMNLVILLLVVVLGGTLVIARIQRHPVHPWEGSPRARRILIMGIGFLWVLDGVLQAQPLMVTQFVHTLLVPLLVGQPRPITALMRAGMHLWQLHPLTWDIGIIWLQILLGVLILLGADTGWRRIALWLSIGWGLIVWVGGEGLGSLLSGGSWFIGSPGSVALYAAVAILLLLPPTRWSSPKFRDVIRKVIAALWALFAFLQAWPGAGWWSPAKLSTDILTQAQMAQPGFISAPLYALAHLVARDPKLWNGIFVALFCLLALVWGISRPTRLTWLITVVSTIGLWWFGQDLGVFGGMGTDPNSGAVLLLGLIVYADLAFSKPQLDVPSQSSDQFHLHPSA